MSDHHYTLKQIEEINSQDLPLLSSSVHMFTDYPLCDRALHRYREGITIKGNLQFSPSNGQSSVPPLFTPMRCHPIGSLEDSLQRSDFKDIAEDRKVCGSAACGNEQRTARHMLLPLNEVMEAPFS